MVRRWSSTIEPFFWRNTMRRLIHNIDVGACLTVDQKYRSNFIETRLPRRPRKPQCIRVARCVGVQDVFASEEDVPALENVFALDVSTLENVFAFEQDSLTRA